MYLSHRSESIRQRCRAAGNVGQSLDHATKLEAAVESVGEGAEVTTQVLFPESVAGSMKRILDVAQHGVDLGKV